MSPASPDRNCRNALAALLAPSLLAGVQAQAAASQERSVLPGVEVSTDRISPNSSPSPKFTAPLRDTPQTVQVIPNDVFTQQGATTLSDALRNSPGITFAAGEGGGAASTAGDAFYMRGFDTSNNLFVDGVRDVGAYSRDVFNLEQIEVAKGPAGADVGRGASSGYVNTTSKVARSEHIAVGTLAFGHDEASSGNRRRATLDLNRPIASPIAGTAVRLNVMRQDSDAVGRDVAKSEGWAIAPSLALGLGTPTRAYLSYQHAEQDNVPDYGLPGAQFPGFVSTPPPPEVDRATFYGFTADYDRVTNDVFTARLEHDTPAGVSTSNQTRFSAVERDAVITTPGNNTAAYTPSTGLLTRSRQGNKRNTDVLSNQTNLRAQVRTGGVRHDLSAGIELARENAYTPAFTAATLPAIPIGSPDASAAPAGAPVRSGAFTDVRIDTAALYAFDTLSFGRRWQVNGGARWESYQTDFESVAATGAASRIEASDTLLAWKGGLVFKPVPAGSVYASYGVSQKPPGSDFTLSSAAGNQNNPDTAPQETRNAELGTKWDLAGGRLVGTLAFFRTENDKTVFTDPVLGAVPAGRQKVEGLELSASGRITDAWLVFGGLAYLDSEIEAGTAVQVGASLPLVARVSGNFWSTYRLPSGLTLGGGAQYSGEANRLQTTAGAPVTMPSYWLFNAVASHTFGSRLTVRLNVSNLLDEEYAQSFNNNGGRFAPGAPRSFLLTTSYAF